MRNVRMVIKRLFMALTIFAMMISVNPQPLLQNNPTTVEAAAIKLNHKKVKLRVGQKKKLILKNADGVITWKSNKKNIVKVNKNGKITAKKKGNATITAIFNEKKYKCKVTVLAKKSSSSNKSKGSGKSSGSNSSKSSRSGSSNKKSGTVYWTPSGSVYHSTRNCPTLSRSRTIYSGTISQSGKSRGCKVCY